MPVEKSFLREFKRLQENNLSGNLHLVLTRQQWERNKHLFSDPPPPNIIIIEDGITGTRADKIFGDDHD